MIVEVTTAPLALKHGLPPFVSAADDWDELPEELKALGRASSEVALAALRVEGVSLE